MGFKFLLALLLAIPVSGFAQNEADTKYKKCVLNLGVEVKELTKAQTESCLIAAGVPNPGPDLYKVKFRAWVDCLTPHLVDLDDGISPASEIARAVTPRCSAEWLEFVASNWLPPSTSAIMAKDVRGQESLAVPAVLAVRRAMKGRISSQP